MADKTYKVKYCEMGDCPLCAEKGCVCSRVKYCRITNKTLDSTIHPFPESCTLRNHRIIIEKL